MTAVYNTATGQLVSIGTVVVSPLPAGLTAVQLSPQDAAGMADGSRTWDPATKTVVATVGWVDPATATSNRATIETAAAAALAANTTYLGLASPTNNQVIAQIRALTQQTNKLIRLTLGKLEGTD